jgi:hypothetical protein
MTVLQKYFHLLKKAVEKVALRNVNVHEKPVPVVDTNLNVINKLEESSDSDTQDDAVLLGDDDSRSDDPLRWLATLNFYLRTNGAYPTFSLEKNFQPPPFEEFLEIIFQFYIVSILH